MIPFVVLTGEELATAPVNQPILFKSANEFSQHIQRISYESGNTLIHTLTEYCEQRDIDPEDIAKLISKPLKEMLALEFQESGLLKKTSTATFDDE